MNELKRIERNVDPLFFDVYLQLNIDQYAGKYHNTPIIDGEMWAEEVTKIINDRELKQEVFHRIQRNDHVAYGYDEETFIEKVYEGDIFLPNVELTPQSEIFYELFLNAIGQRISFSMMRDNAIHNAPVKEVW